MAGTAHGAVCLGPSIADCVIMWPNREHLASRSLTVGSPSVLGGTTVFTHLDDLWIETPNHVD
jgi:hypothetical protein